MPTKHIDQTLWEKIEQQTVNAVIKTKTNIKDTEMLKWLIIKGLETITVQDYIKFKSNNKKK